MNKVINSTKSLSAVGPYSLAREVNRVLYCSGQIGINKHKQLVPGGISAEFKKIMENTQELLETAGYSIPEIVKVVIYLRHVEDFSQINQLYSQFFSSPYPVRTTIGGASIPLNANVEIEITAIKSRA